jgi:hypothetical protein
VSLDFDGSAMLPIVDGAAAAAIAPPETQLPAATVTTAPKQDKLAKPTIKPAMMELASAESRLVTLPPAPVKAAEAAAPAPAAVSAAAPSEPQSKFSFHGLVLALCGALGAASALRFIVGA